MDPDIDERLLRVLRTRGHGPRADRAVARFSKLGERGAVWIAIGAAGYALDAPRRPQWRRAMGAIRLILWCSTPAITSASISWIAPFKAKEDAWTKPGRNTVSEGMP